MTMTELLSSFEVGINVKDNSTHHEGKDSHNVQDLQEGLAFYLRFVSKNSTLLTAEEEACIARLAARGDVQARKKLAQANLRLVLRIARRSAASQITDKRSINMMDLVQEGNVGLMKAVEKFNPQLGYRFSTYATWWIQQSVLKALNEADRPIRLPGHVQDALNKLRKLKASMENPMSATISSEEQLAAKLGFSVRKVQQLERAGQRMLALDSEINFSDGNSQTLGDSLSDDSVAEFGDALHRREAILLLRQALKEHLDERENDILCKRYGLDELACPKADSERLTNASGMTLESIGRIYGVTRECIRQTEARALRKLRTSALLSQLTE